LRARTIARSSLHDARRSVFALRPLVLVNRTLGEALAMQLTQSLADTAVIGDFTELGVSTEPSNLVATELLRIAQEACSNVLRHANAKQIRIRLLWAADKVTLKVEDDGKGFDTHHDHPGFGLVSMRERSDRMGAVLKLESENGLGTTVCVSVDPNAGNLY
jgi:signal transduction histidine kinase